MDNSSPNLGAIKEQLPQNNIMANLEWVMESLTILRWVQTYNHKICMKNQVNSSKANQVNSTMYHLRLACIIKQDNRFMEQYSSIHILNMGDSQTSHLVILRAVASIIKTYKDNSINLSSLNILNRFKINPLILKRCNQPMKDKP